MSEFFLLFLISFIANTFSAFAGGGAGLLQLPVLLFLGLPFSVALATHKLASVALGIGATVRHFREGSLNWHFSLVILFAGLPGVIVGALSIVHIADRPAELALGVLTMGLGIYSVLQRNLGQSQELKQLTRIQLFIGYAVLFCIGVLNGSLASGTGLFVTIWLVRWFGLDYKQAVAYTLVLVGLFWNGLGALTLAMQSSIRWDWVPILFFASMLGGYVGAHLAIKKGNKWIKITYEVITLAVGAKLILG
ncbi:MAG: sulfite exporter TauE/SafE family protein [Woeseiaceae bacterium]